MKMIIYICNTCKYQFTDPKFGTTCPLCMSQNIRKKKVEHLYFNNLKHGEDLLKNMNKTRGYENENTTKRNID